MTSNDAYEAENMVNNADSEDVMTDVGKAILERKKLDPTYGLTADQK